MGIGFALASGLVQGFTQNIGREMERRTAEKEKLESYKLALYNAALTGGENFSKKNAEVIGNMVSAAQGKLDEQEGINLFGTKGASIFGDSENDFTSLLSQFETGKKDAGMVKATIGNLEFLVPEEYEDQRGTPRGDIILYEGLADFAYKNPEKFENHFVKYEEDRELFRKTIPGLAGNYLSARTTSSEGAITRHLSLDKLYQYDYFNKFFHIDETEKFNAEFEAFKKAEGTRAAFRPELLSSPELVPVSAKLFKPDAEVDAMAPFILSEMDGYTDDMGAAVQRLSEIEGQSAQFFLYNYSKQFDSFEDFEAGMQGVTELYIRGAAEKRPDPNQLKAIGQYLVETESFMDDPELQARVLMPFRPLVTSQAERDMIAAGIKDPNFVSSKPFDEQFKSLYGYSLAKFTDRVQAMDSAKDKLKRLEALVQKTTFVSGSFFETIAKQFNATFGVTGRVDQVLEAIGVERDSMEAGAIRNYLTSGQGGDSVSISEKDTLRYIIAADLARAEDDQGRLSDGDIQRNLQKVSGFGATTKAGEIAAIREVGTSLETMGRDIEALRRIADSGVITREDRRFMRADRLARRARRAYLSSVDPTVISGTTQNSSAVTLTEFNDESVFSIKYPPATVMRDGTSVQVTIRGRQRDSGAYDYYGLLPDGETLIRLTADEVSGALESGGVAAPEEGATVVSSSQAAPKPEAQVRPDVLSPRIPDPLNPQGSTPPPPAQPAPPAQVETKPEEKVVGRLTQKDITEQNLDVVPRNGRFVIGGGIYERKEIITNGRKQIVYDPVM
jgi:hypothetical protein